MVFSNAFDAMQRHYTALAAASSKENAPDADIDIFYSIKSNQYNFTKDLTTGLNLGLATVNDFFQDSRVADVKFVHNNIDRICDEIESVMRETIAKLEYDNSSAAGRRVANSAAEIDELTTPNEVDVTIKTVVSMAAHAGKPRNEMYIDGVTAVYDRLREQIRSYMQKMVNELVQFESGPAAAANTVTANAVIKHDWRILQETKEKLMSYELTKMDMLEEDCIDVNTKGLDLIDDVAKNVHNFYDNRLYEVYKLASRLFPAMTILEFDLKYSTQASVNA